MISVGRIERWAEREQFQALFDAVVRNGRPLPLAVRLRLSQPGNLAVAALGLGLQRVLELSFGLDPAAVALGRRLAAALTAGGPNRPGAGAMVIGVAALVELVERVKLFGCTGQDQLEADIDRAIEHANHALLEATAGSHPTPAHRGLVGDGIESAVVFWQVAGHEHAAAALAGAVDPAGLRRAIIRSGAWKDPACAGLLALADASAVAPEPGARAGSLRALPRAA